MDLHGIVFWIIQWSQLDLYAFRYIKMPSAYDEFMVKLFCSSHGFILLPTLNFASSPLVYHVLSCLVSSHPSLTREQ